MQEHYYLISVIIIVAAMAPFFLMFEKKRPHAREVMMIAALVTVAVLSRTVFFMVPFIKPMLAVVIISGAGLGFQCGLLVGTLSAFMSNFMFGQGPWTVWQMLAMGICGALAGVLFSKSYRETFVYRMFLCIYGLLAAVLVYGVIMDTYTLLLYMGNINRDAYAAIYLSGLPVNMLHGISTGVFLALFAGNMIRKLKRIKLKYNF